jgi:molybdate/tungstate transport system permease protein
MRRFPDRTWLVFGLLGGLLLVYLVSPVAYLLSKASWREAVAALENPGALRAIRLSLVTSGIATAIMAVFGIPLGYFLARSRWRGKQLLTALVLLPMVFPPVVGGILLLLLYGPYGPVGRLVEQRGLAFVDHPAGIVLAQMLVASPFLIIAALSAFVGIDEQLEQAAATLGDSRWRIFRRISFPLAWPGIAAGITLAWIRALGEFGATLIVAYNPHTVPIFLWVEFTAAGLRASLPAALFLVLMAAGAIAAVYLLGRLPAAGSYSPASREAWKA